MSDEQAAIERGEAGLYRLTNDEVAAVNDNGIWPIHPDPDVVVVHDLMRIGQGWFVRWYRRPPSAVV